MQGGGLYAFSAVLREAIAAAGEATVQIDLLPDRARTALERNLDVPRRKQSLSTFLRKAVSLSPAAIGLLQEVSIASSERLSALAPAALVNLIKAVPIRLVGVEPIVRAISSAGGISFDELDENFMLRRRPGIFAAGEMLDWEAPTGGYLLQAAFATAPPPAAARWHGLNDKERLTSIAVGDLVVGFRAMIIIRVAIRCRGPKPHPHNRASSSVAGGGQSCLSLLSSA